MIVVAAIAIVMNLIIGFWLHAGSKHDINVRSAYLHMIGDAVSAFGVVLAGIVVVASGWQLADPIVSFLIAGLILWSSWGVLEESVSVLLEGTPRVWKWTRWKSAAMGVRGVLNVHDLHVWTVGPGVVACSCHVLVAEQSIREGQQVLRAFVHDIEERFHITHTTVQVEVEGCDATDMYCSGQRSAVGR